MTENTTSKRIKTDRSRGWLTVQKTVENMVYVYETPDAPVHISHVAAVQLYSKTLGRWVSIPGPTVTELLQ